MSAQLYVMEEHSRRIQDYYKLGSRLGQPGQFGHAMECVCKKTGAKRAVKVINKSKFKLLSQRKAFYEQLREEISVMRNLHHENIIKFSDVYEDEVKVYIVMERCTGGELFDRISAKGSYSEHDASVVLRQVVTGLKYLHSNKIAHCDLKPDNFLFLDPKEDSVLKIIDFGMSKIVKFRKYFRKFCGTPYYVAPEVIDGMYTEACDMWSVGVIMFVMLFGYPPFYVDPSEYHADNKILAKVKKGFDARVRPNYGPWFPQAIKCSASAKDLISKLLNLNHSDRLSAAETLAHPWFTGGATKETMDKLVLDSLKTFRQVCQFKHTVLNFMINHTSDDQIQHIKAEFRKLDKDGNGEISRTELTQALRELDSKTSESDIASMMENLDVDGDGVVSYEELCMASVNRRLMDKEERLWKVFRLLDENGDGRISAEELAKATADVDFAEAKKMIAEVDIDGDGTIDYEEFLLLFREDSDDPMSPISAS